MSHITSTHDIQKPFDKHDNLLRLKRVKSDIDSTLFPSSIAYRHFIIHQVSKKRKQNKKTNKEQFFFIFSTFFLS